MEFFIHPNDKNALEKKLNKMFTKLETKPKVEYSEVQTITTKHTTDFGRDGEQTIKSLVKAIKVTIDGLDIHEWQVVAEVDYYGGMLLMCNHQLFKSIPSQYGLNYKKCDHCGGMRERKTSFIMHNKNTNEWCQVGSSCVNKMVNGGKYLADVIIEIHTYVKFTLDGCMDADMFYGGWNAPQSWRKKAVSYVEAIQLCKNIYDKKGGEFEWAKGYYDKHNVFHGGTNEWLIGEMENADGLKVDEKYIHNVMECVMSLDCTSDFNKQMQDAFTNEYIELGQMFLPFFAMKSYEDSIKRKKFNEDITKMNVHSGDKLAIVCELVHHQLVEMYDSFSGRNVQVIVVKFKDENGVEYKKTLTSGSLYAIDKYKVNKDDELKDGTMFRFNANVKRVDFRKVEIILGGRLSKYNAKKL